MRTKYILHIDGTDYELRDDDLENWEQIKCSYKRASFDGVVRSFSSQFEFVNYARDMLLAAYIRNGYAAKASISVHTFDDRWRYECRFVCPLDFTTVSFDSMVFSISSVDDSLAAKIKSSKSTTYELAVGSDIKTDGTFYYDRLPLRESITYGLTDGLSYDDCPDILVTHTNGSPIWVGNVGSEIANGGVINFNDDQTDSPDGYLFEAIKDVDVTFKWDVSYRQDQSDGMLNLQLRVIRDGITVPSGDGGGGSIGYYGNGEYTFTGEYDSEEALNAAQTPAAGRWALVGDIVWVCIYTGHDTGNGSYFVWQSTDKTIDEYFIKYDLGEKILKLKAKDKVLIEVPYSAGPTVGNDVSVRFIKTLFEFSWISRGAGVELDVISPRRLAGTLLRKIAGDECNVDVAISDFDTRLKNTYILPAEVARGIDGAKLYSSFNDFADWMSTVFGYVYYMGPVMESRIKACRSFGRIVGTPYPSQGRYSGVVFTDNILYNSSKACFFYHGPDGYYDKWSGCEYYNGDDNHPRTDILFCEELAEPKKLYTFPPFDPEHPVLTPIEYEFGREDFGKDCQTVHFVHRAELLSSDMPPVKISGCRNLKYTVDASLIYSTVIVGYDKKDYENTNGRDEFNFSNTYTTGCSTSDKTLSMLSKYRPDCYGIEFALQKRAESTTDSSSDKDVFFLLLEHKGNTLMLDRNTEITGALSDMVFNGAFSPMACIHANAGYIGLQSDGLILTFASSTGNSAIVIGGEAMDADIALGGSFASAGVVEFTSDEVSDYTDMNRLVEVVDQGVLYRGFIKEVDFKYARNEAAKYKIIVKDIEL